MSTAERAERRPRASFGDSDCIEPRSRDGEVMFRLSQEPAGLARMLPESALVNFAAAPRRQIVPLDRRVKANPRPLAHSSLRSTRSPLTHRPC